MKAKDKFKPGQMVEAVQPCFIDVDGVTYSFNPGRQRVKAEHPAVQSNPDAFQALDQGDSEKPAA
jgi:transcription antitermination factor NusG